MAQTITDSYTGTFSSTAVQLARDSLAGFTGDYLFIQDDQNHYILLLSDDLTISGFTFTALDAQAVVIEYVPSSYPSSDPAHYTYQVYSGYGDAVYTCSSSDLCYSSVGSYPRLIEGGVYYEAFQSYLLVACCVFVLIDRIFRRVF